MKFFKNEAPGPKITDPYRKPPGWTDDVNKTGDGAFVFGWWTPSLTFATPGNLSVSYSLQRGWYQRVGNIVRLYGRLQTSAFTHTTAAGELRVSGFPFTSLNVTDARGQGSCRWSGVTKAGFTDVIAEVQENVSYVRFNASGSGVASTPVVAADTPTGGTIILSFDVTFIKA
jgi:hypothetical protein